MKRTIIIGAGIAGLACAIRRKIKGDEVLVLEENNYPGGKLHEKQVGNYRFDGGPSLFTQPGYVEDLFSLAGLKTSDHFQYDQLEETCRYFWEDGTRLTSRSDIEKFEEDAVRALGVPPGEITSYLKKSEWKYQTVGKIFLERSLHRWSSWMDVKVLKALFSLGRYDLFKSLHQTNQKAFSDEKLVQLFDRYATYNGSDPFRCSGMLSIIPQFEFNEGAFFPRHGMYSIASSLFELGKSLGVQYQWNCPALEIKIARGKVEGVQAVTGFHHADRVVSNVDVYNTYERLLPQLATPEKVKNQERSSSAHVFYWGIKESHPELGLHNILFSEDYKSEFEEIKKGNLSDDPTVYIHISSKKKPDDAPPGKENWFVMINSPSTHRENPDFDIEEIRSIVLKKIQRNLQSPIEGQIEVEDHWSPSGIEQQTASFGGALYGSSSNHRMAAFQRHPNAHPKVKGLYFCGGSVHPGGGIPLCLLSAKITSQLINRDNP